MAGSGGGEAAVAGSGASGQELPLSGGIARGKGSGAI
jgi:hypothetical protein